MLSDYICRTNRLPVGNEPDIMLEKWGFSYALRPYLSAIVGALFMKAAGWLGFPEAARLPASRMCSVLSVTLCCFFCLRLGHMLFKRRGSAILLAVFVCLMPQVLFLGMYQNNDSLSLAAAAMLLSSLVSGHQSRFSFRSCAAIAVSLSLVLLSYYSAYGWILFSVPFCVLSVLRDHQIQNKARFILSRAALIAFGCLVLAGWFFIRNAVLHQGDFLGLAEEHRQREQMIAQGAQVIRYQGMFSETASMLGRIQRVREWFTFTARSLVGVFGYMTIYLRLERYGLYYAVFALAFLLFLAVIARQKPDRKSAFTLLYAACSSLLTVCLSFFHSVFRDYQPQGRYVITILMFIGLTLAYGMDRVVLPLDQSKRGARRGFIARLLQPTALLALFLAALCVLSGLEVLI